MQRRAKLLVVLLLVGGSAGLILWNTSAQTAPPALGVSDAKYRAADLDGRQVTVRGNVVEGSIVAADGRVAEFVVADAHEQLRVVYGRVPPDNFGAKEVVVTGTLRVQDDGTPILEAASIQVGCASKY